MTDLNVSLILQNASFQPPLNNVVRITAQACGYYPGAAKRIAIMQLIFGLLALFWFGPRGWLQRPFKDERVKNIIGLTILAVNAGLAALLAENLVRWS